MIIVTSISHDQPHGAVIEMHCSVCRISIFVHSPYCIKPERGDYFRIEMCEQFHSPAPTSFLGSSVESLL